MAGVKSLAKDTAIYGTSSIIGKFLNWCLTPLYVAVLVGEEYGTIVNLYAWIGLMLVFLTYGLETGFFRFANDQSKGESQTVFSTCLTSITATTALFLILIFSFLSPISTALKSNLHPEYIIMITLIIALDVLSSLPFAYLRYKQRPIRFASLKLLNIFLTIVLNLFFLILCPLIYKTNPGLIDWFYNPTYGVGYILVANLIASAILLLILIPDTIRIRWSFNFDLLKKILRYSFPLLILGLAGMMNQTLDKILFPYLFDDQTEAMTQLAIYGASTKIAVVMIMFTQAFRYAYEPFIFSKTKGEDKRSTYALAMKYFIIIDLLIFLGIMFFLDVLYLFKEFIAPEYFAGLKVVPIIMIADLFAGVFFNLSLWYKLTDRTHWGIYFSLTGLAIIVSMNVSLVPHFGYIACAWAAFACYFVMMFLSWIFGQKYYPINYNLKSIGKYVALAAILYVIGMWVQIDHLVLRLGFRSLLLLVYITYLIKHDLPLSKIPYIKRFFK